MTWGKSSRLAALMLCALLAACGLDSEQSLIEKARVALDKGNTKEASIQLKNVLQKNPDSASARFLFGKLLLEAGDIGAAEIELRKAQDKKHPVDEVAPLLARALLVRQHYKQVIADYAKLALAQPDRQADLSAVVASAYAQTGQREQAVALVDATLSKTPQNNPIRLVKARLMAGSGDVDTALTLLEGMVSGNGSDDLESWRLLGDLRMYGKQDSAQAQAAYRKVLELRPDDMQAHTQLIGMHLLANNVKAARQQFDTLAKARPSDLQTGFLGAHVALREGNVKRARDLVAQLAKFTKDNPGILLLAGATELQLNSLAQAESHLNRLLALDPNSMPGRRLMAAVYLRTGQAPKAIEVLRPLLEAKSPDVETLNLAAEAHLSSGDAKKAETFFARVAQLNPGDVKARTALALAQLANGDVEAALADLQSIASGDKGSLADMALIEARLRQRDLDGALKAIDALEQKVPNKPMPADLRGRVQLMKRDSKSARTGFEAALARDPVYFPSASMLAQLDIVDKKPELAQERFQAMLKKDPTNVQTLVALAGLRSGRGAGADEVAALLTRAIEAKPTDPGARLLLIDHWLKHGNPKQALSAAQAGLAAIPDNASLIDGLGRAQLANDEVVQALSTFGKLAAGQPKSAFAQLRLADAHLRSKNPEAAEQALRAALSLSPDLIPAQRGLIILAVQAKQPEKALQIARSVQRQRPHHAIGHRLEGDVYVAFKDLDQGAKAYRAGLAKEGGSANAVKLYTTLDAAKRGQEAEKFAASWLKQSPKETGLRSYLGAKAMASEDWALAEKFFRDVVALEPRNLAATNNLAWVMVKTKKPDAVALAERALELAPEDPSVLDTLAVALAQNQQLDRALEASKSAVRLAPTVPVLRLTLAKLHLQANDKKAAKAELEELAKLGAKFPDHQEVNKLLKSL